VGIPTGKIAMFGAIFKVNSNICKLWDLLGYFGEKDTVDFIIWLRWAKIQ